MRPPKLPIRWYDTFAAVAHDWGVHVDAVEYYAAAGLFNPAAVVRKSLLPMDLAGAGSSVVVPLPDYRSMDWQGFGEDRAAPLIGEYRAFEVDGQQCRNLTLRECDHVLVTTPDLVIPLVERENIEAFGGTRALRSDERRTLLLIIADLARRVLPDLDNQPYALAEDISVELCFAGSTLSRQAIVNKLKDALALLPQQTEREAV